MRCCKRERCNSNGPSSSHSSHKRASFIRLRHLFRPKMIVFLGLILCWGDLTHFKAVAVYQPSSVNGNNGLGYYFHQQPHHHHQHHRSSNVRLRAPQSLNQLAQLASDSSGAAGSSVVPLGGAGITPLSDETSMAGSSSIVGPREMEELSAPRRKKDCGEPSIATRGLLGPTLKRSYFAFTQDEVEQKTKGDEYRESVTRKKRDIQHQQLSPFQVKRNGGAGSGGGAAEVQDSPLPWTCETKYEWKDMGSDHYPRFVRTAECKSRLCFNGFFRCRPRRYKTKVLKRVTPADSTSCEDDDVSLPETLRTNWKFITVTINLCCDCSGRIPGNTEV